MRQTIIINELPPLLNVWQRMHWAKRSKVKEAWIWLLKQQKPKIHSESVRIIFTRVSTQMADFDNIGGSFKAIGDALTKCGVIQDDNPEIVKTLTLRWEKSNTLKDQHVKIEIEDV
jgi:Holliday junction resolvase RusA-like endonuclease